MQEIKRNQYLNQLLSYRWDGQIKVITGIRRCGKSYLLGKIYKNYRLQDGVKESNIISIQLDFMKDISFPKIMIRKDIRKRWYDDDGILNIGLIDFLLDPTVV